MPFHKQARNPKLYFMIAADVCLFAISLTLAYLVRFEFSLASWHWQQIGMVLSFAIPVKFGIFMYLGLYRGMWRYTDIWDAWRALQASFVSTLLLIGIVLFFNRFEQTSRSVFVIDGILTFVLCGGLRASIRTYFRYREGISRPLAPKNFMSGLQKTFQRVLIIGAGNSGEKMLREIIENPELSYDVIGFLDDNREKIGRSVHGVPVLGQVRDLQTVVRRHSVQQIFIAMPSATGQQMRKVTEHCQASGVAYKTLPGIGEIMDGRVSVSDLREVSFRDLLGRKQVELDHAGIERYLSKETVLVSGAGGSIGSELCRQIVRFNPRQLILLDSSEYNLYAIEMELRHEIHFSEFIPVLGRVQDVGTVESVFSRFKPSVVFHAAAYKHVPILEHNPWEAVFNNVTGTRTMMETALKHHTDRFVVVSTDKAVRPTNVMGATKRVTELLMHGLSQGNGTKFMAVRFGNVIGSSGSVIPLFKKQIAHGGPVTVTHPEMTRYFMTIQEASQLILQAGALGQGGEIFVLDMGVPVKIADMAKDLIRLMGKEPDQDIEVVYTGLRPGEKIFEELITDEEGIARTEHSKIMVLTRNGQEEVSPHGEAFRARLIHQVDSLIRAAARQDRELVRKKLKEIVPEYQLKPDHQETQDTSDLKVLKSSS